MLLKSIEELDKALYSLKESQISMVQVNYTKRHLNISINACFTSQIGSAKVMAIRFIELLDKDYHFSNFILETHGNEDFLDLYIDLD